MSGYKKVIEYIPVDPEVFYYVLNKAGYSLSDFESLKPPVVKRAVKYQLKRNHLRKENLYAIAKEIDVNPSILSGNFFQDKELAEKKHFIDIISFENFPFLSYEERERTLLKLDESLQGIADILGFTFSENISLEHKYQMETEVLDAAFALFQKYTCPQKTLSVSTRRLELLKESLDFKITQARIQCKVNETRQQLITETAENITDKVQINQMKPLDVIAFDQKRRGITKK